MQKIQHRSNNAVLGAPAGWDQGELPVSALPITRIEIEGMPAVASYWRPTEEEIAILLGGDIVELVVLGGSMPTVSLSVVPE